MEHGVVRTVATSAGPSAGRADDAALRVDLAAFANVQFFKVEAVVRPWRLDTVRCAGSDSVPRKRRHRIASCWLLCSHSSAPAVHAVSFDPVLRHHIAGVF